MSIPLHNFENVIDPTILKRGFDYFKKGLVSEVDEVSNGAYEALVLGSEEYTVNLEVKNNEVVSHHCNCPYDLGPICKHEAAVFFYLQKDVLDFESNPTSKTKAKRSKSVAQQTKELLKAISQDELNQFIEEKCKSDKKFRAALFAKFGHLNKNTSKEFYQNQINAILNAAKGRHGWIEWSNMKYLVNTTEPFVTNAENNLENGNFENVFYISTALLEAFTEAFEFADDSNGDLGYFIHAATDLLYRLTEVKLSKSLKSEFFDYCITTYQKKLFSGWDWHLDLLAMASELIENEKEADTVLQFLDSVDGIYEKEQAQRLTLQVLQKYKHEKEVETYIEKHIANPSIRTEQIKKAFESKNFEKAIKLSKKGILQDQKDKPGLVKDWYNWLLEIAQAQKDTQKIIEYARYLFIDNFYPKQDYYNILKTTIKPEDWHPFLEKLIIALTPTRTNWKYTELLRKIYIEEQWWDRLYLMLKQNVSLDNIEQNEKYLSQDYNSQLLELYEEHISNYVEKNVGRNHYQEACRYLRRMKKLGGQEQARKLIENFKAKYPQRKALMDELTRV